MTARAEVTLLGVDENHPAALVFHALNDAAQIAVLLPDEGIDDAGDRIAALLTDAGIHVADLFAEVTLRDGLISALEDDKRSLLEENHRLAVTLLRLEATDTRNKQQMAEAQHTAEELTRDIATLVQASTDLFTKARGIRLYDVDRARPLNLTSQDTPRMAAARS